MAEFSLIERYFQRPSTSDVALGIGDDSAILIPPNGQQLVICADTMVAGRHFPLDTDPHAIGWKCVAVNLSDIAAMGAAPHSILLALTLPQIDHDWLTRFSQGLFDCCDQFGVRLIGGDTTQGSQLTLSVTALGWQNIGRQVPRAGAKVGDLIVVSGQIGDAAFGLAHQDHPLKQRLDYPTPRCTLGLALAGVAHSMIDISDGLAQDLGHILTASGVAARLNLERLPIDDALHALPQEQQWQYALAGGDDYELCFSISPEAYRTLQQSFDAIKMTVIGEICTGTGIRYFYNNQEQQLQFTGYEHFATS